MSSILSRSWHPYIICGLWRLSHCSPSSSQGWLYSFSPYVIRSSVDDGANFVNCAACCKLHGVEGYLHVSCWLSSLIRPVFSCQLLRNRYNVRPCFPWRRFYRAERVTIGYWRYILSFTRKWQKIATQWLVSFDISFNGCSTQCNAREGWHLVTNSYSNAIQTAIKRLSQSH